MAKLSLREIKQSQLDAAPVVDGQLVFCTDTGNLYRDVGSARMRAGSDIEIVSELPLAPIEGKVYCLRGGDMWLYEGGDWLKLNQYTHPTTSGNKHIPSGGSAGQFLKWSADGTAVWAADNNTTYNNATQSSAGLMSSTDKKKLDSVNMANACMYDGTSTDISEMQSTCDYIDGGAY